MVKFDFCPSKLKKQPFLLKFSKSGGPIPPVSPSDAHARIYACSQGCSAKKEVWERRSHAK